MPESKIFYENIVGINKIVCKLEETEPLNAPIVVVIFRIFCYNNSSKIYGRKEILLCQIVPSHLSAT